MWRGAEDTDAAGGEFKVDPDERSSPRPDSPCELLATAGAVLNIRGRFAAPVWAPLVNSVIVIAVGLVYLVIGGAISIASLTTTHLLLLAVGTTAGVLAQMVLVVWALARSGFPVRPRLDPRGIGIRRIGRLGSWVLVSVVAAQVCLRPLPGRRP